MSALAFDPWRAINREGREAAPANPAKAANPVCPEPDGLAGLARLAGDDQSDCNSSKAYSAPYEAEEQAALPAERPLPPPGTPERAKVDRDHAAHVAGMIQAARKMPASWWSARSGGS